MARAFVTTPNPLPPKLRFGRHSLTIYLSYRFTSMEVHRFFLNKWTIAQQFASITNNFYKRFLPNKSYTIILKIRSAI